MDRGHHLHDHRRARSVGASASCVEQLREAQAGLADRARADERNRIARELHDVIAHTLTVSLLHVSSAQLAVDDDPDEAARRSPRPSGWAARASTRSAPRSA